MFLSRCLITGLVYKKLSRGPARPAMFCNPVFDQAVRTIKIIAGDQLLFPKNKQGSGSDVIGIQVTPNSLQSGDMMPPPERKSSQGGKFIFILIIALAIAGTAFYFTTRR